MPSASDTSASTVPTVRSPADRIGQRSLARLGENFSFIWRFMWMARLGMMATGASSDSRRLSMREPSRTSTRPASDSGLSNQV